MTSPVSAVRLLTLLTLMVSSQHTVRANCDTTAGTCNNVAGDTSPGSADKKTPENVTRDVKTSAADPNYNPKAVTLSSPDLDLLTLGSKDRLSKGCVDTSPVIVEFNETAAPNEFRVIKKNVNAKSIQLLNDSTKDAVKISEYFTANSTTGDITLQTTRSFSDIADYPRSIKTIQGFCNVTCNWTTIQKTEYFSIQVEILDSNTVHPRFSNRSYSVSVLENYPVNFPISSLLINASDYDRDANNNVVTFSLDDNSTFSLTEAVQTSTSPATFTTQLMLTQSLDWSQNREYRLTVTATDPGKLSSTSNISITVVDFDDHKPVFNQTFYTVDALNPTNVGALKVVPENISAFDEDRGKPLQYSLFDTQEANWTDYFYLDPESGILSLKKEIPVETDTPSAISFMVEVRETTGLNFSSTAMLEIHLSLPPPPEPQPEDSDTGYIVALVLMAIALVAVMAILAKTWRERQPPVPPQPDFRDHQLESAATNRGISDDEPAPQLPPRRPPSIPARPPPARGNSGYRADQSWSATMCAVEYERQQNPATASSSAQSTQQQHFNPSLNLKQGGQPISCGHISNVRPISSGLSAKEEEEQERRKIREPNNTNEEGHGRSSGNANEEEYSDTDSDSML